jgi:uncharacterized membrane protein (UPF0136 family)
MSVFGYVQSNSGVSITSLAFSGTTTAWDQYLPDKAPSLRFATSYEGDILNVGEHNTLFQTWF